MAILDPSNYAIAWIAPLEIEARAAILMLDEEHQDRFPVGRGDDYVFHAGVMGTHNVIIATLPAGQEYGTGSAAALASQIKKFLPNLWFALLVGVAAGLPDLSRTPPRDIRLGDVLVGLPVGEGSGLLAYDLGKETDDGFHPIQHGRVLATTEPILRSAIGSIKLRAPRDSEKFLPFYDRIRDEEHETGTFADPGQDADQLFTSSYTYGSETAVQREPRPDSRRIRVWYGSIGSGDKLLKNAQKRNELRDRYDLIGLEMEAAGIMNRIPVCVIRGVCDYGDHHKNKIWQPYAAAMAAAYARALLDEIPLRSNPKFDIPIRQLPRNESFHLTDSQRPPCYHIQLTKNQRFTGRNAILEELDQKFFGSSPVQRTALVGLGGAGKTQIALSFAYQIKETRPEYSIFWVPLLSHETTEQAFVDIAKKLNLQHKTNNADKCVKDMVCQYLSADEAGKWLFIIDNADDQTLVSGSEDSAGLDQFFPTSDHGILLMTTRLGHVAEEFAGSDVLEIKEMSKTEAEELFQRHMSGKSVLQDERDVTALLGHLTFLPLAITQAAAYLNQSRAPVRKYLGLLQEAEQDIPKVLGREFKDPTRYRGSRNAVGTTWLVSFDQLRNSDQVAPELLSFMACIEPKAIPQSILPSTDAEETEWALGTLCAYSFLTRQEHADIFDIHNLVHLAMRG